MSHPDEVNESPAIREVLFGDVPISEWPGKSQDSTSQPWLSFVQARDQLSAGKNEEAKRTLLGILAMPDLESRQYLQAWNFLRELGTQPSVDEAKQLYGVVVEVALEDGWDIVAAYADHTARYFNYSGAAMIWEKPNESLDLDIDALLNAGRVVAEQIGPWEGPRPPAPDVGQARINLLLPSGLHFGQGPLDALASDPMGGPVITSAMQLMQALIAITEAS